MKKIFEFNLILIIFYGVYSAFEKAAPVLFDNPETIWVIFSALIVAALIVAFYSFIISSEIRAKAKKDITHLKTEIKEKETLIAEKEDEVKAAQTFKEDLIKEAEQSDILE